MSLGIASHMRKAQKDATRMAYAAAGALPPQTSGKAEVHDKEGVVQMQSGAAATHANKRVTNTIEAARRQRLEAEFLAGKQKYDAKVKIVQPDHTTEYMLGGGAMVAGLLLWYF